MDFWETPQYELWQYTYLVLGLLFLAFSIFYVYKTIQETCSDHHNIQGKFQAQITYIAAIFTKAICLLVSAILLFTGSASTQASNSIDLNSINSQYLSDSSNSTGTTWSRYQVLPGAIPGYVSALAYTMIFFSWCSVCYDALEKSTIGFYKQIKTVLIVLTAIIIVLFLLALIIIFSVNDNSVPSMVEAIIAAIRDVVISICFIIYLKMISSLFSAPCPNCCAPENRLFSLLILLIFSLLLRPICALVYNFVVIGYPHRRETQIEFSVGYYIVYLIEFLLTEIMPLGMIGLMHLTSSDSYSTPQDDSVAAFLGLD